MYREAVAVHGICASFPHRRGGVPLSGYRSLRCREFSPQAWGCTAGMSTRPAPIRCFPHRRGGVPLPCPRALCWLAFSPQAWGCTVYDYYTAWYQNVFPTGVGVYRHRQYLPPRTNSFPHRRGGVPLVSDCGKLGFQFSPQAWGCTAIISIAVARAYRFPHRRGGVPDFSALASAVACVFPTGVGVYRETDMTTVYIVTFSPQAWGCTAEPWNIWRYGRVFPTGVGVYRGGFIFGPDGQSFPHRRGGVPSNRSRNKPQAAFSPQAWGCTGVGGRYQFEQLVFPTGVGVYRGVRFCRFAGQSFPHRRGGVPLSVRSCKRSWRVFPTGVGVYRYI